MLFPRKNDLSGIERIAISLILNFTIVSFFGLMLNFTSFGIRLLHVLVVLSAFTISVSLLAWIRRMRLSPEERFSVPFKIPKFNLGQSKLDKILFLILIASVIGSSITLAYVSMNSRIGERFTEFYLLGSNGLAFDYPTTLMLGDEGPLIIGIINHEYENTTYRIVVNFNDRQIYDYHVFLIDTEMWETPFTFQATLKGENQKLEFLLYKEQQIKVYRTLNLLVTVK